MRPPLHSQGRAPAGAPLCHLEEGQEAVERGRGEGREGHKDRWERGCEERGRKEGKNEKRVKDGQKEGGNEGLFKTVHRA